MKNTQYLILFFASMLSLFCEAQVFKHDRLLSFEESSVPPCVVAHQSRVTITKEHFKDGARALQWDFQPNSSLTIEKNIGFEPKDPTGKDTYLSSFVAWVYNETPTDDIIEWEFLKGQEKCSSFSMGINFKGWRAVYISFERDMQGTPQEGMNIIRIKAPKTKGRLFFDQILPAAKVDHRHHTADMQLPFVNAESSSHWLLLYRFSLEKPDIALEKTVSAEQQQEIATIEQRWRELLYTPSKLKKGQLDKIRAEFRAFNIKRNGNRLSGLPLFFARSAEAFERLDDSWTANLYVNNKMELRAYFDLMQRVAIAYHNACKKEDKEELKQIFIDMYDHATDQGVAYGSGLGNITHYGYSFRNFFHSYFLMKDVLRESSRLEAASKAMLWYGTSNETYIKPKTNGIDMDAFNTIAKGRICSILMMENTPEKVQYLKSFSRWINNGCLPAPGLNDAFKIDGSAYHHCNNYPAYAVGGLSGATDMLYLLHNTSFAISELGHETVKNVLLTMRFYCNKTHFPIAMSGRHPNGKGELSPIQYARMAMAGTPNGQNAIDEDMAAAFLRLVNIADKSEKPAYMPSVKSKALSQLATKMQNKGFSAEKEPNGNRALPYAAVSVQRRNNWAAVVRGHSRYLWAAEHYLGANLYGRYLAHGSMQITTAKETEIVSPKTSAWIEEGFDWGRIPGTTAIHLPIEQLKAKVLNVDVFSGFEEMLYSDEAFAGGVSQNKTNGAFGMKLHEHDKYNGSHRARKSYHFFDNRIVCIGTDIENINAKYNTETTIFQLAITSEDDNNYWSNYKPVGNTWVDHLGTAYYIPSQADNLLKFENEVHQHSRFQNSGKENEGHWVSLVVDHGKAPKHKSYEYMVVPQAGEAMANIAKHAPYRVLQKDRNAHIVRDLKSKTTSYVLFETPKNLPLGLVQKVDTSCLIMLSEGTHQLQLTVANPDLALYRGKSDEAFSQEGKRMERSIYSRPWISNESKEMPVVIVLKGKWSAPDNNKVKVLSIDDEQTTLQFLCADGASIDITLEGF